MNLKIIQKIIKFTLLITVSWVFLFGLSQMTMNMGTMNGTVKCPFDNHSMSICQMNPLEHIKEWQSMFTVLPIKNILLLLFGFFALLAIQKIASWCRFSLYTPPLRYQNSKFLQIFNPFQELFSSGILNPKTF